MMFQFLYKFVQHFLQPLQFNVDEISFIANKPVYRKIHGKTMDIGAKPYALDNAIHLISTFCQLTSPSQFISRELTREVHLFLFVHLLQEPVHPCIHSLPVFGGQFYQMNVGIDSMHVLSYRCHIEIQERK